MNMSSRLKAEVGGLSRSLIIIPRQQSGDTSPMMFVSLNRLTTSLDDCGYRPSSKNRPIPFHQSCFQSEVDDFLHVEVFPIPFGYLEKKAKGKAKGPLWSLVNKEKQQYELANLIEPTGTDLARYCGRNKCGKSDANVIIGMASRLAAMTL